jgi:general secretion pathway protein G
MASLINAGELMSSMSKKRGFTLIELVVVMSIIGLLLTLAAPRYFASIEHGKQAILDQNIYTMRDAIDKYFSDNGQYPENLSDLVNRRYLRSIPVDPFTKRSDWVVISSPDENLSGIFDVQSSVAKPVAQNAK